MFDRISQGGIWAWNFHCGKVLKYKLNFFSKYRTIQINSFFLSNLFKSIESVAVSPLLIPNMGNLSILSPCLDHSG